MPARRFPPPWSVEELEACFVVKNSAGQKAATPAFNVLGYCPSVEGRIAVRAFLTLLIGAILLGGCAAKPTAGGTTANAAKPTISDGLKSMTSESSPASEDYKRAVANYSDCVLDHTANLTACEKQRAIMNGLGKVSSRSSLSQSYTLGNTQITNTAGITQGANTANTTQAAVSHVPANTADATSEAIADAGANSTTNVIAEASANTARATNNVITASANLATSARNRCGSS